MKKFFTLIMLALMSCVGASAQTTYKVEDTPISNVSEFTSGIYAISICTNEFSGFMYYNTSQSNEPFCMRRNTSLSSFSSNGLVSDNTYLWKIIKEGDNFSIQCVQNNEYVSNIGADSSYPKSRGNIKKVGQTVSSVTAEACHSFTLGNSRTENNITRWLIYKTGDGQVVNNAYPYLHTNTTSTSYSTLSYWEGGSNTSFSSGSAIKVAFYKASMLFPAAGTHYVTITGKTTDRYNYLHSDVDKSLSNNQFTWLAQNASTEYNYIWKVVVDENKNASIINAQGTPLLVKKSTSNSDPVVKNSVTFEAHSTSSISGAYYIKISNDGLQSGHNCLNVSDNNYANGSVRAVTAWQTTGDGTNAADNHWAVEEVTSKDFYDVVILDGTNASGADFSSATYVTYSGQKVFNGGFFAVAKNTVISKNDVNVANIPTGKIANVDVAGNTITITCVNSYSATITAGNNGNFGTLCLPYATTVPTGVDAYTLTTLENEHIAFTKAYPAGSTLPAEEPVLIVSNNAGSYNFVGTTNVAKVGTNIFLGTPNGGQVDMSGNDIFVLAMDGSDICFMRTTAENVNPYKAYIKTSLNFSAKAIKIDFEGPTAINGVISNSENTIFDLSGRKVSNTRNGFYIVNGKKVLR